MNDNLEKELSNIQCQLMAYKDAPKLRAHYETLYLDLLQELRREPQHVWKPYIHWYTRYQGW